MPRKKVNSVRTNVFLSEEAIQELKEIAERRGTSVSGLIRMIVLEYLSKK